jgi:hypothetical protein
MIFWDERRQPGDAREFCKLSDRMTVGRELGQAPVASTMLCTDCRNPVNTCTCFEASRLATFTPSL